MISYYLAVKTHKIIISSRIDMGMKRYITKTTVLALILAMTLLLSGFTFGFGGRFNSWGRSRTQSYLDLNQRFQSGIGPTVNGHAFDYKYYQPTGSGGSYPLVIWLHGMGHGSYPGSQLQNNNISNWSSSELQSRFSSGGAYILCPRCPEDKGLYWWNFDGTDLTATLKGLIDDFIAQHPDIDTSRIYIGGFSLGGNMTVQMCQAYPDFFAAAFPVCPALDPTEDYDLDAISTMPMWIVASSQDPRVPYSAVVKSFWEDLCSSTKVPGLCRLSTIGQVLRSNGQKANSDHQSWLAVTADMFTSEDEPYYNMTTVNGAGTKVELSYPRGMISWLSAQKKA